MRHFLSQFHIVPASPGSMPANDDHPRRPAEPAPSRAERDALYLSGRSDEVPDIDRDRDARFAAMLIPPYF